jgi:endogenous inhibitor of DNA gyrase (YacG/DUF329 family)
MNKDQYNTNPNKCAYCDGLLDYSKRKNKFCNRSCSVSFTNSGGPKHGISHNCIECNKKLGRESKSGYCLTCKTNCNKKDRVARWLNGENYINVDGSTPSWIKDYLINKYGNQCQECGWNKINSFTNKIPVQMDHIDGNSYNNIEYNLRILCPNCHSLTSTYGNLNKGKGRKNRKR